MPVYSTRAVHKLLHIRWTPEVCSLPKCLHPLIYIASMHKSQERNVTCK